MHLKDKRALVTGGSRGIGAAVAIDLARNGAHVAVNARHHDAAVVDVLQQITALDRTGHFVTADVGVPADAQRCVAEAADALGGMDILVHSAGGPSAGRLEDISPEQWNRTFDVHVHAAFHLCRHALSWLQQNGEGVIILVSSAAGIRGCPGALAYGTVKGAVLQFTRALARDLADDNIRVNCVAPGIIRTRFHEKMTADQQAHNLANRIPLHREGTVDDVAQVVHLLMTNEFMTGEFVTVDGGMSMQIVR